MHWPRRLAALAALVVAAPGAFAASIDLGASSLNGNALSDHSASGLLSFDVQIQTSAPIELVVHMDPGEDQLDWNGHFERPTELAFLEGYRVTLSGATLVAGSVRESLAREVGDVVVSGGDSVAEIGFDAVESAFALGDAPGVAAGASDWRIDTPTPGASFGVTLTPLPEPGFSAAAAAALLLAVLARLRPTR